MKAAMKLVCLATLSFAACLSSEAATPTTHDQSRVPAQSSLTAGMDAGTGMLRTLSDDEILALSVKANALTPANSAGLGRHVSMPRTAATARKTMRRHANGVTTVDLPLSTLNLLTASIGRNGQLLVSESTPAISSDQHGGEK